MSVRIRLARGGTKKRPFYRIVATDKRSPRDGRFLEKLGSYNPLLPKDDDKRDRSPRRSHSSLAKRRSPARPIASAASSMQPASPKIQLSSGARASVLRRLLRRRRKRLPRPLKPPQRLLPRQAPAEDAAEAEAAS